MEGGQPLQYYPFSPIHPIHWQRFITSNGQLLNSIHCHEQWSSGRFSLFNYFKTSSILRRFAPAAAARNRPLVAQKRCTSLLSTQCPWSFSFISHWDRPRHGFSLNKHFKCCTTLPPNYFIWKWSSNFIVKGSWYPPCFNCPPSVPPDPEIPSLRRQPPLPSSLTSLPSPPTPPPHTVINYLFNMMHLYWTENVPRVLFSIEFRLIRKEWLKKSTPANFLKNVKIRDFLECSPPLCEPY